MKISASIFLLLVINPFFSLAQNPLNPDLKYMREGNKTRAIASLFTFRDKAQISCS